MRTYGAHGGENQLAQYFSAAPRGAITEHFAFVYKDEACARLFEGRGAEVVMHDIWPWARDPASSAWREVMALLPILPALQWRFVRLLRATHPRVCVVHGVQAAIVAWPIAMLMRRRTGFMYVHRITKATGTNSFARLLYLPYQLLGGVSQSVTRSLASIASEERLISLDNGVDWRSAERRSKEPAPAVQEMLHKHSDMPVPQVIIAVGRLLPHKRQALLIRAFAQLPTTCGAVALWIVGGGQSRASLEEEARHLGVERRIIFWGHRADVPALLVRAAIFANASSWEGMSNAVLEAMALGLPSVVLDAPGVSECHVDGETGVVIHGKTDEERVSALTAALSKLLGDPLACKRLGDNARSRVKAHYSMEANRQRFLDAYRRLTVELA